MLRWRVDPAVDSPRVAQAYHASQDELSTREREWAEECARLTKEGADFKAAEEVPCTCGRSLSASDCYRRLCRSDLPR